MKKFLLPLSAILLLASLAVLFSPAAATIKKKTTAVEFHEGDLIFQTLDSELSEAIMLATHSKYSHCGMVFKRNGQWCVYEAIQPVQVTPLNKWTSRGQGGHYVVKRLKNATLLNTVTLQKMRDYGAAQVGKEYDIYFNWSDDRMYCSELIWKTYKQVLGLEIGKLQKLKEFDLTSSEVKKLLKQFYGDKVPLEEPVISPESVFNSELLEQVSSR